MEKTVLVTGATGAIGAAAALEIAKTGARAVLLARNKDRLEAVKNNISLISGNKNVDILTADYSDIPSVKKAADQFMERYDHLDALINVAALFKSTREVTKDNLEMMFSVNHLSPFILTTRLLSLLKKSAPARIITITAPSTTRIHFDDLQGEKSFSALNAFGASKMMNLMFTYALSRRLEGTGVAASAFHPGLVRSGLTREMPSFLVFLTGLFSRKPDKASKMLCKLALDSLYPDLNGKFYRYDGKEIRSSAYSYDKELQDKLWLISIQLSGY